MSDWQVMAHQVDLPVAAEQPIGMPAGWEPIGTLSRQGNKAVLLVRRQAQYTPPAGTPVLTSLTPSSLPAGSTPATVDVIGTGFDASSTIDADGQPRATFYLDATHLEYTARPDLTGPATVQITVQGPNGASNALPFTYT
jgi:hypothetical protein